LAGLVLCLALWFDYVYQRIGVAFLDRSRLSDEARLIKPPLDKRILASYRSYNLKVTLQFIWTAD
jgi:hypothetical protein